ncbi:uncharacterized protein K452DRAFT_256441 [Aplosporella prunicola CBS 121167]|uniref:Zn(2)-C6 fungal-type domain-containing protein n=1 Tax=Aplosporella prunicola CBS 121167 TaxID=1176127 RepID=A0A6A6B500_9PEZI|nr:uncharacterized protein K452DRAFT_256441 [Aplosporella prunicola CBS 121167]KAF2138284.1 hypothetical protein K452DRAFT_256441 [Aplosporella prunicola CBS 121167]
MADPSRIDPRLEFGVSDAYYSRGPSFYDAAHPQPSDAALQAIATAAQEDRRASTASSASVGAAADLNSSSNQTKLGPDGKRLRACDHCRALKVRCDPQDENGTISETHPCKRCKKSKKTCITTAPTKKRTKKADTRVAELEKKVNELTARLGDAPMPPYAGHPDVPLPQDASDPAAAYPGSTRPEKRRRTNEPSGGLNSSDARREIMYDDHAEIAAAAHHRAEGRPGQTDYSYISYEVDRCMDRDVAERVIHRYVNDLAPAFPAVPLPQDTTAAGLRTEKPLLFLSILTAASYGCEPVVPADTQRYLADLLQGSFAELIWRKQEKTLEIIQALIVGVLWYRPPAMYEHHAFYMMINAASSMALELGLGKRAGKSKAKLGLGPFRRCLPNAGGVEARRAFMACYYLGANIAMILRRPMFLRWNKYMDECVTELETASDALPSDKIFCYHLKLAAIAEDVASQFSMDDPAAANNLSDKFSEIALRNYDTKLESLRQKRPAYANNALLQFSENVTGLFAHEVAAHHNQNADDNPEEPGRQNLLSPVAISSLQECIKSCHGLLENFLSLDFESFHALPVIYSVRAVYSTVCLAKLWADATTPGDISATITPESLRLEFYFENLIRRFLLAVEKDPQSPHAKFHYIVMGLREKFTSMKSGGARPAEAAQTPAASALTKTTSTANPQEQSRHSYASGSSVPSTQTPLHLLSEVAQQAQAPPIQQTYYDNGIGGQVMTNYSWDMAGFGNIDFSSIGMDVDLSGLFGGDMGYEANQQYLQMQPGQMYPEANGNWNA